MNGHAPPHLSPHAAGFEQLWRNAVVFSRLVRRLGIPVQPERTLVFARSLRAVGFATRYDVKAAARSVFMRAPEHSAIFDRLFDAFWNARCGQQWAGEPAAERRAGGSPPSPLPLSAVKEGAAPPATASPAISPAADGKDAQAGTPADAIARALNGNRAFTYSFAEGLYQKDFSQLSEAELARAEELTKRQAWSLGRRLSRRTLAGRGSAFDARRTLRASLRRGGDVSLLVTRARRAQQRDLVLICDISGSMDRYSRLLLQFVHTVRHALGNVEAFVFGTRLTRITRELRHREIKEALENVSASVPDCAGGTRIGESLRAFNTKWARRVLSRGAIVIIVSDGWDRGDASLLTAEMQRLQRAAFRLIWLNPLLGSSNYRPQTIGMKAALPFVDDFLPAHNLKSLFQLAQLLQGVEDRRPSRPTQRAAEAGCA